MKKARVRRPRRPPLFKGNPVVAVLALVSSLTLVGCNPAEQTDTRAGSAAAPSEAQTSAARSAPRNDTHGPNVVLITLDTVRADALGFYGQPRPTSPELDRLAREGVFFEQVASSAPSTLPSHASIMTGLFPFAHGARSNSGHTLSHQVETLAEVLRANGYRTGAEIAAPVINATTLLDQGFEHYQDLRSSKVKKLGGMARGADGDMRHIDIEERDASDITNWGIRFLAQHESEPFFLWLHYFDPHRRYAARAQYDALIPDSRYHAEIRYVDTQIGKLVREIEARGLRDRTLVAVVADHGEGLGEHGETTHSHFVYDTTIRVPLLFWGPPDIARSEPIDSLVRTVDVAPTILDYLDLSGLDGAHGVSLLPSMRGEASPEALDAYGESIETMRFVGGSALRFLRRGNWKYIHKLRPELYDLAADPNEENNLAASHPEKLAELRTALEALIENAAPAPGDGAIAVSPEETAQLRALGYLGETEKRSDFDAILASTEVRGPDPNDVVEDVDIYARALAYADNGEHQRVIESLAPLVERYPESSEILLVYGEALLEVDENTAAKKALSKVLELTPCSLRAHDRLALTLQKLDAGDEEFALMRQGAQECPDEFVLLNNYAYALATDDDPEKRDADEALRLAERALTLAGGDKADILDTVAAAHAARGDLQSAVDAERRALTLARRQQQPAPLINHLRTQLAKYEADQRTAEGRPPKQ